LQQELASVQQRLEEATAEIKSVEQRLRVAEDRYNRSLALI